MTKGFLTNIGILGLALIAKLPFWLIYMFADIFYFFVYYVFGYRKLVVINNLRNAFPEKSEKEIQNISKKYYRHFSDLMLESIKSSHISQKEIKKRMIIENPELINQFYAQGKSVVVLTMHYNNWEWSCIFPMYIKHTILGVYKPLHNQKFDELLINNRARWGAELIQNKNVLRRIVKAEKQKEPVFIWLAGDQTPPGNHEEWFTFLHQDALFYPGPAAISRRFKSPVFFQKIEKTGRGKYNTKFELLFEDPTQFSETEIIKTYIQRMEELIREKPEFYLWSHRRWKHKKPADIALNN
ncbi:MAG: lysophospholipid acyltransferase family protein [Draconibacterium sp.]